MNSSGRDALQRSADGTGGSSAYVPEGLDQVNSITRAIAHDIRSEYIAYKPRNQNARPSFQSVRVEARAPGMGASRSVP